MNTHVECIVIGSGPGGCTTALTLLESGKEVLILEEGLESTTQPFSYDEMKKKYRHSGINAAFGDRLSFTEGMCLGGGSEVNSGLYHRLPESVASRWGKALGNIHFSKDLNTHFDWVESQLNLVETTPLSKSSEYLKCGADSLGWAGENVKRWVTPKSESTSFQRHSMTQTLLPKIKLQNGKIKTGVKAMKIYYQNQKWHIKTDSLDKKNATYSCTILFICAGAIMTPHLLLKSGIHKGIGESLRFHPFIKCMAEFDTEVISSSTDMGTYQIKAFSPTQCIGSSISTKPFLKMATLDYSIQKTPNLDNCAIYYMSFNAETKGHIIHLPGFKDPLVLYRMLKNDWQIAENGKQNLINCLFAAGAKRLFPFYAPGKNPIEIKSNAEANLWDIKNSFLTSVHVMGSCPLGYATNEYGKVRHCQNLFVNDASLFCSGIGVNPQGTVMALARRNALQLLDS